VNTMFFLGAAILIVCAVAVFLVRPRTPLLAESP
jgi:hypothetical protein